MSGLSFRESEERLVLLRTTEKVDGRVGRERKGRSLITTVRKKSVTTRRFETNSSRVEVREVSFKRPEIYGGVN